MKSNQTSNTAMAVTLDWNSIIIRLWVTAALGFALSVGSILTGSTTAHGGDVTPERPIFRPSTNEETTGSGSSNGYLTKSPGIDFAGRFEWNQISYRAEVTADLLTLAREDTGEVAVRCKRTCDEKLAGGPTQATDYQCSGFPLSGIKTRASIEYGNSPKLKLGSWVDGYETAQLQVLIDRKSRL